MTGTAAPFVLHPMQRDDLDAVVAIEQASFSNPWTRAMFEGELSRGAVARAWVVRERETEAVLGYCLGWLVAGELHISNLAVAPAARRRGVARWMLGQALARVAAEGGESAILEVRRSNVAALKLYSALGFRAVGVRRRYYSHPQEDAVVLAVDHLA
jgi:ribosomal-protein-alanine N-acetyltransferase